MRCIFDNSFFLDLFVVRKIDIIFFCLLNNFIGVVAIREELIKLVEFVKENGSIIVYDFAYVMYILDDSFYSIFEILGVKEVSKI